MKSTRDLLTTFLLLYFSTTKIRAVLGKTKKNKEGKISRRQKIGNEDLKLKGDWVGIFETKYF